MDRVAQAMKAVVVEGPKQVAVREVPAPGLNYGQVYIQVDICLLCTWEQRLYQGLSQVPLPFIAGHEAAGTVIAVHAKTAAGFSPGDRVVFQARNHCGHCHYCYQGFENQCIGKVNSRSYEGIPAVGGLARYISMETERVYPVKEGLPPEEAAFTEPLACCVHSVRRAGLKFGDRVVVVGGGLMGQFHALLARLQGAHVTLVEPLEKRRNAAVDYEMTHGVIDPGTQDPQEEISRITGRRGADAIFITAPLPGIVGSYEKSAAKMGRIILFSSFHPDGTFETGLNHLHYSEKIITGSASPSRSDFYQASRLLWMGLVPVRQFLTAVFPSDQAGRAFEAALDEDSFRVGVSLD